MRHFNLMGEISATRIGIVKNCEIERRKDETASGGHESFSPHGSRHTMSAQFQVAAQERFTTLFQRINPGTGKTKHRAWLDTISREG